MPRFARTLAALVFFLSGFAALTYQVVWQRVLTQEVGVDSLSVAFIVTIFMIGLGFGSLYGGAYAARRRHAAVVTYAILEVAIGLFGLASVPLLRALNAHSTLLGIDSILFDFAVNCLLLGAPTFLMGMTSPLIMELMKSSLADWGSTVGKFYGLNVLGAAIGSVCAGLVMIELFGLTGTAAVAAAINIVIGGLVFATRARWRIAEERPRTLSTTALPRAAGALCAASVLLGFVTLSIQMVSFRVLANYFTLSAIVFPLILTSYLLLMSVGQFVTGKLVDRVSASSRGFAFTALTCATSVAVLAVLRIQPADVASYGALVFSPSVKGLDVGPLGVFGSPGVLEALLFSLVFMVPVFFASGFFPAVVKVATSDIGLAGHTFGVVLFWFTVGNILGAFVTPIILLAEVGTIGTLRVVLGVCLVGACLAAAHNRSRGFAAGVGLAGVVVVAAALALPADFYQRFRLGGYQPIATIEGRTGVVTVVPTKTFFTWLEMFRTESASAIHTPPEGDSYEMWRWNMSELLALDPSFQPRRILIIGIGHAYLAKALVDYDVVEKVTIVELSSEIVEGVRTYSHPDVRAVLDHPKVEVVIGDGRRFAQRAKNAGMKYDLIQNRINEPWRSGSSSLFTVEFISTLRDILEPNGYLAMRQMVGYVVNGLEVLDHAFWPEGAYHVYFSRKKLKLPSELELPAALAPYYLALAPGKQVSALPPERALLKVHEYARGEMSGYQINTDDRPTLEYRFLEDKSQRFKNPRPYLDVMATERPPTTVHVRMAAEVGHLGVVTP